MASKSTEVETEGAQAKLRLNLLLRPMPSTLLIALALVVLVAGAAYCSGYEALSTGRINWPASLIWSSYGVLPWLFLFEWIKRREWDADRPLGSATIAGLIIATGAGSIIVETLHHELVQGASAPVLLQLMRRLPGVAFTLLLILLSRREQSAAQRRIAPDSKVAADEAEGLVRHAPAIRWIQAADNYLELHLDGQVWTRRITMKEAAAILEPMGFVRVHRSVIVNRRHVERIVARSGGSTVQMVDGPALPTGRAFNANLRHLH